MFNKKDLKSLENKVDKIRILLDKDTKRVKRQLKELESLSPDTYQLLLSHWKRNSKKIVTTDPFKEGKKLMNEIENLTNECEFIIKNQKKSLKTKRIS